MYHCDVCGLLSKAGESCLRQQTNFGEEKRCVKCYSKEEAERFRAKCSNRDLSINLNKTRRESKDIRYNEKINRQRRKINNIINRINKNKKVLGVMV